MGNHLSVFRGTSNSRAGVSNVIAAVAVIIALVVAGGAGYALRSSPAASTVTATVGGSTVTTTAAGSNGATVTVTGSTSAVSTISKANASIITVAPFFGDLQGIVYNPTNKEIYVAEANLGAVAVLDGTTGKSIANITLANGTVPVGLAYDSANNMIYVANDDSATCSPSSNATCSIPVIDPANNTVVANIPMPDQISDVAVNPTTGAVYATSNDDDATFFANATSNRYVGMLMNHSQIPDNSEIVAVDTAKNLAIVGNSYYHDQPVAYLGWLSANSTGGCQFKSTNESYSCVSKSASVLGGKITGIAINPTTGLVYVSNYNLGMVNVFSESTGKSMANITVKSPSGIVVNPVNDMVYVASNTTTLAGADSLYVINGSSNTVLGVMPVTSGPSTGAGPENIALDTTNNTILLSNASDGTIWIIEASSLTP
jgi:DNA-binding beta-propeller fold protein YncE